MKVLTSFFLICILQVFTIDSPAQDCLYYENDVELTGIVKRQTFPGRPNYESIKKGDEPETHWVLHLDKPICARNSNESKRTEEPHDNVYHLQLLQNQNNYKTYKSLLNKKVLIKGRLFSRFTGHHHTKIMITVNEMKKVK